MISLETQGDSKIGSSVKNGKELVEFFKVCCLDFMSPFVHCLSSQKSGAIDVNRHIFFGYGMKFLLI